MFNAFRFSKFLGVVIGVSYYHLIIILSGNHYILMFFDIFFWYGGIFCIRYSPVQVFLFLMSVVALFLLSIPLAYDREMIKQIEFNTKLIYSISNSFNYQLL